MDALPVGRRPTGGGQAVNTTSIKSQQRTGPLLWDHSQTVWHVIHRAKWLERISCTKGLVHLQGCLWAEFLKRSCTSCTDSLCNYLSSYGQTWFIAKKNTFTQNSNILYKKKYIQYFWVDCQISSVVSECSEDPMNKITVILLRWQGGEPGRWREACSS